MNKICNIVIADDHKLFADGLSSLLMQHSGYNILAKLKTGRELVTWYATNNADVALVDLNMPGIDGIEASRQVLELKPSVRIIIVSMYADPSLINRLQKTGIAGYIKKDSDLNVLISCIEKVQNGYTVFNAALLETSQANPAFNDDFLNRYKLSHREREILSLIRQGFTSKDIADRLFLSSLTVETHRKNISQKLGLKHAGGLLRFAIENDL